jgi:cyanate lyase
MYGQAKPELKDIEALSKSLNIVGDTLSSRSVAAHIRLQRMEYLNEALGESFIPHRGVGEWPPKDPVVYRLYEALLVYGHPLKHIIHEKVRCLARGSEHLG